MTCFIAARFYSASCYCHPYCFGMTEDATLIISFSVQAQKELLDAELDLYKKTQAGEDTAMLKIKYTQLQIEVMTKSEKRFLNFIV